MGVERTDYVIVGCNLLSNKKYFEEMYGEDWLDELYSIQELEVIYDGMSNEYLIIGKVIRESEEYEGFDFKKIDLDHINEIKNEVKYLSYEQFKLQVDPELYVFTHWY